MYRSPYTTDHLVNFDDDGLCFSKDFRDTGYSGYINQGDMCQAFEIESYGTLTMTTEDHLRNAKRARLSTALRHPISSASLASRPTNSAVSKTPQASFNTSHVAATQRLAQYHEYHIREKTFKLAGEADNVRLAIKCA